MQLNREEREETAKKNERFTRELAAHQIVNCHHGRGPILSPLSYAFPRALRGLPLNGAAELSLAFSRLAFGISLQ